MYNSEVKKMEFKTQYTRTPSKGETGGGVSKTERAGYIPAKARIENLMLAGQRLVNYRKELYDFQDGEEIDESFYDPTRSKGFDLADGTQLGMQAKARLEASATAAKEKKAAEEALKASQNAQEGQEQPSKTKSEE